jgi:glucosamine-6-phosphate deaminase
MATIHIVPASDEEHVHRKLVTLLLAAVVEKPDLVVSVFAGTPAYGLYRLLTERAVAEEVDFSRARFVVFDELAGVPAATRSPSELEHAAGGTFRAVLQERLFQPLGVPADRVVAFDPDADPAAETARIRGWLNLAGVDVALLSVDSRGHVGFHTAGAALDSAAGMVKVENRVRWGADRAFSLGLADLGRATHVLLFACGKNLAEVVQRLTEGGFDPDQPVSVLQRHPHVTLVADRGALSQVNQVEKISGFHAGFYILDAAAPPSGRTVLVVSPHPDDAAISAGGTMALLAPSNRIVTAIMTTGHRSFIPGTQRGERIAIREREAAQEARVLGSEPRFLRMPFYDADSQVTDRDLDILAALLAEIRPDWLFIPHRKDGHPAHQASRRAMLEAVRRVAWGGGVEVWSYEGPWALFGRGDFDTIVPLPRAAFEKKAEAIRAHASQVSRTPFDVAAESLARLRSALVPEAELSGFGAKPPRLEPWVELFRREGSRPGSPSAVDGE